MAISRFAVPLLPTLDEDARFGTVTPLRRAGTTAARGAPGGAVRRGGRERAGRDENGQRFPIDLISAISPEGGAWPDGCGGEDERRALRGILEAMAKGRRKPICLIIDGHPAHRAKVTTKRLEKNERHLRIVMLPGYSPHLDSEELVRNELKSHTVGKRAFHTVTQLRKPVRRVSGVDGWRALVEPLDFRGSERSIRQGVTLSKLISDL